LDGHVGDTGLGRSESVAAGQRGSAGSRPGGQEFLAGAFSEDWCATVVGEVESLAQRRAGVRAVSDTAERGAVVDQCAGAFEACASDRSSCAMAALSKSMRSLPCPIRATVRSAMPWVRG
jgi:hypothetical protein